MSSVLSGKTDEIPPSCVLLALTVVGVRVVGGGCSFLRLELGTPLVVTTVSIAPEDGLGLVGCRAVVPSAPNSPVCCLPSPGVVPVADDGATVAPWPICSELCCCWFIIIMSIRIMGSIGIVIPVSLSSVPLLASVVIISTWLPPPMPPAGPIGVASIGLAVGAPAIGELLLGALTRANSLPVPPVTPPEVSLTTLSVGELTFTVPACPGRLGGGCSVVLVLGRRSMSMVDSIGC